jgi:excisionase family DNA binding protein
MATVIRLDKDRSWLRGEREPGPTTVVTQKKPLPRTWLTVKQAADRLGVSIWFVYDLISNERVVAYRIGRRWKIGKDAIEAFIEAGRNGPAAKGT